MKTIDARGLSCPEPVLLTKQALAEGEFPFTVLVDDETPRENIMRFAKSKGLQAELSVDDGDYVILLTQ